jgi:twitching motility protein PilT
MILDQKEEINNFFKNMYKLDPSISDIFLNEKKGIAFRAKNKINKNLKVKSEYIKSLFNAFFYNLTLSERDIFRDKKSLDTSYALGNVRYRITFYRTYDGNSIAIRILEQKPWSFDQIGIDSKIIEEMINNTSGILLISGPTSAGKSTTMNSVINKIGDSNNYHIIAIEDPIEFIYNSNTSYYSQREIGTDVKSYEQAIIDAMRSNPNVIVLGEIRDSNTALQALRASQTGHLVISTIHADSVINTIERFLGLFEEEVKNLVKNDLASSIRGIINQRIVKTTSNEPKMIFEHIFGTTDVVNKIKDDSSKLIQLRTIMGTQQIKTLDQKLQDLYKTGKISTETFQSNVTSFEKF